MSDQQRPVSPDGQWEWDGTAWVPRTQPSQPPQQQPTPPGYNGPAQLGAQSPSEPGMSKGKKVLAWVGGAFAVMIVLGMIGGGTDTEDPSETSASSLAESAEDGDESGEGTIPADQAVWLGAVADGQEAAEDANELQVVQARKERGDAMCDALGGDLTVTNWVGEVETIKTTTGGDGGVLDLVVAEDVKVGTWNNGLSDLGTGSIIDPDSDLWTQIIDLEEGDKVYFSGRFDGDDECITESSVMDENGMLTPSFIFKFTSVGLVSDGPLAEKDANASKPNKDSANADEAAEEPVVTEADEQPSAPVIEGDGTWMVGSEIKPGIYVAEGADFCTWERLKGLSGGLKDIIANGVSPRPVVNVMAGDKAFGSSGCGSWTRLDGYSGGAGKKISGDGIWIVGKDLVPGTYRAEGGDFCTWERLRGFGGGLRDIITNGVNQRPVVTVAPGDKGFGSAGCGAWSKVG